MAYVNKPRPYKKEYQQQKARGEHAARMERQRARRKMDKEGVDKNKNKPISVRVKMSATRKLSARAAPIRMA